MDSSFRALASLIRRDTAPARRRAVRTRHGPALIGIVAGVVAAGCKDPARTAPAPVPAIPGDAGASDAGSPDAAGPAQLAEFPKALPVRVIELPARRSLPRFDVGGPVIVADVAVVSSSQFGFAAVDWRTGQLAWTKPAGLHVAPPLAHGDTAILIGDCLSPPDLDDVLLGCLRVVSASGADRSYTAIHGARLEPFAREKGSQQVWLGGERTVRWRRGALAVAVDLVTGAAVTASAEPPPVRVHYGARSWDISHTDGRIIARERGSRGAKIAWQTRGTYTSVLGAVYLRDQAPMVRANRIAPFAGLSEMNLFDIDATGSLAGQVSFPVPAISMLGAGIDDAGATAIALRLDSTLRHDYIAGFAASALLMYVYPLPEVPRADPVGIAIAPDGVLVFHDGDLFTVLPELSAPATAPGPPAAPAQIPSRNSTP